MPKLPHLSGAAIVKALEQMGFAKVRQSGSHVIMKRDTTG
jgi:predicted RNA binding protein YcfA (HicA-like mRNA interferase family)